MCIRDRAYIAPYYKSSLIEILNKGKMSEETARNLAQKLCLGLTYIHMSSLAHMDIKPDNIMLDDDMNPIIIDFGLCG